MNQGNGFDQMNSSLISPQAAGGLVPMVIEQTARGERSFDNYFFSGSGRRLHG
jgi:hypothetical protein